jgi:hypothetical protein
MDRALSPSWDAARDGFGQIRSVSNVSTHESPAMRGLWSAPDRIRTCDLRFRRRPPYTFATPVPTSHCLPAGRDPGPGVEHLAARPFAAVLHHYQADELRHKASPWHFDAALRGSCDRASTDGPYIATGSGGAPIGLRDHRRALDLLPPRSARPAPSTSNGAPASRPTAASAGRHAARDKRRHAPQRALLVGESLWCRFGQREAGAAPSSSLRGEPRDEISGRTAKPCSPRTPRIDLKDAIIQAFADGFADKPCATFGTMNAVLAEKLPGYVRPNSYAIIRGSKHRA